jgi:hypothetical protein
VLCIKRKLPYRRSFDDIHISSSYLDVTVEVRMSLVEVVVRSITLVELVLVVVDVVEVEVASGVYVLVYFVTVPMER